MSRRLALLLTLLLVHQAWPDQLGASYLARSSSADATPLFGRQQQHWRHQQQATSDDLLFGTTSSGGPRHSSGPRAAPLAGDNNNNSNNGDRAKRRLDTDKLVLLTDGHQIKLFPLDADQLAPSGGHFVIKPGAFELADARVAESLARANPRHHLLLKHQQQQQQQLKKAAPANASDHKPRAPSNSILPQRALEADAAEADEPTDTLESVWRKPFISSVGHFFDDHFCSRQRKSSNDEQQLEGGARACLVIYWLDQANGALHLGALQLNASRRMGLLETRFEPHGASRAPRANLLKLDQFPPLDLCRQFNGEAACQPLAVRVELAGPLVKLHASFLEAPSGKQRGLILTGQLEAAVGAPVRQLELRRKRLALVDAAAVRAPSSLRNLVAGQPSEARGSGGSSSQLLHLGDYSTSGSTEIVAVELELAPVGEAEQQQQAGGSSSFLERKSARPSAHVLDVQWETAKMKVRRAHSNKLAGPFGVQLLALAERQCALVWLTSDHELYASSPPPSARQPHSPETRFLGKLVATRPLIRAPIATMQLFHGSLFFVDSARRSLMAHKLPPAGDERAPQAPAALAGGGSVRDERVPKLSATHRVLLVEPAPIQDFELVELADGGAGGQAAPPCSSLGQPARRRNHEQQAFEDLDWQEERARDRPDEAAPTATFERGDDDELQEALEIENQIERAMAAGQWQQQPPAYQRAPMAELAPNQLHAALLLCLLAVVAALLSLNCFLWRQRNKLLLAAAESAAAANRRAADDESAAEEERRLAAKLAALTA